ncbi:hypothetical protein [Rhizobium sp. BK377]|jgi:hypothetical protein|uniref:hypothetical protein n=1 Tax=Rhizobium sp. BK377 TaxID=2587058 RepID=UPI0018125B91|nr:hypothetical protein [Rhizobium sp. BK377]MBB3461639.1 hypothetical protein [Rhizobium sp. BK377]
MTISALIGLDLSSNVALNKQPVGGYLGGALVRVLPANVVHWFVILAGTVMTIVYAVKYWS